MISLTLKVRYLLIITEIYSKIEMDSQQSHVFNLQLIELVKKNPLLYDHSHPGHKNKIAKEQCWLKISEELNFDGSFYFK